MDVEIRAIGEDEFEAFLRVARGGVQRRVTDEDDSSASAASPSSTGASPPFDDGRIVGGAAAVSFRMTVPGRREVADGGRDGGRRPADPSATGHQHAR